MKLKNSNCYETEKLKLSKKLKNLNCDESQKTQIVIKLKLRQD